MTESTLDRERTPPEVKSAIEMSFKILFMVLALTMSVLLLKWAVSDKLAKFEESKGSQITVAMRERQLGRFFNSIL